MFYVYSIDNQYKKEYVAFHSPRYWYMNKDIGFAHKFTMVEAYLFIQHNNEDNLAYEIVPC